MRKLLLAGVLLAAACAPIETVPAPPPAPKGAVALHADARIPAQIDAAFRSEIGARYSADAGAASIVADLTQNGFICRELGAYPQVQPSELLAVCDLPKPHGLCSDMWTVDLKLKDVTGGISVQRVAAAGRFVRTCVSGASPDG